MDGTNITVIQTDVYSESIAVDWISSQLYWSDLHRSRISVCDFEGDNSRILISSGLDSVSGIALDPYNGYV